MAILQNIVDGVRGLFSQEDEEDTRTYSVLNLQRSGSASDLLDAHRNVQSYYLPFMAQKEMYYDMCRPETQWTEEEKEVLTRKKKAIIAFNRMKSSERAFVGAMVQQKYDIKPAPNTPVDQDIADIISALYYYTAHNNQTAKRDVSMIRDAWIGGSSWQESYVEVGPGQKPRICVHNQNNFAIYPDPNRRDLVSGSDCRFIDRVGWYTMDDLISLFPEQEDLIRNSLLTPNTITYEPDKPWADRQHEWFEEKNGRYRVVERFYKVSKRMWYGVDEEANREEAGYDLDSTAREEYLQQNPGRKLYQQAPEEFLYLAVACSQIGEYLYNGPYHCQPRNPKTGDIIFPLVELVDEDISGFPTGHVEHMVGPQKAINASAVNALAQAKNAAGQSHVGDPDYFDEATQKDMASGINDGSRMFWKKKDAPKTGHTGVNVIEQGTATADTYKSMEFSQSVLEDNSSTPPSMKGYSEGNVPAALNEQRLQQSFTQSQVQVSNYQSFLTQRALLWMCYYTEFWDSEEVIRVVQKDTPEDPDFIKVNELVVDMWGQPHIRNSLKEAFKYDLVFEDSWQSPTVRDRVRQQITQMLQSSAVQGDPVLNTNLWYYFVEMTDAPQDLKDFIKQHSQVLQQQQQKQAQVNDERMGLEQATQMQDVADREASATVPTRSPQMAL